MNKEELLKAIEQKRQEIWPTDTGEMAPATVPNNLEQGWLNALAWMKRYINSLPAEKPSEEFEGLEDSIIEYLGHVPENEPEHSETLYTYEQMQEIARHFANWQKDKLLNKACQWLNKTVVEYHPRTGELKPVVNINAFREAMEKEDEQ